MDKTQEALKMAIEALKQACGLTPRDAHFCKAIQACKEALAQPAQEPVAWMFIDDGNKYLSFYRCLDKGKKIPLYAKESIDD